MTLATAACIESIAVAKRGAEFFAEHNDLNSDPDIAVR